MAPRIAHPHDVLRGPHVRRGGDGSACGTWRYVLDRDWTEGDRGARLATFVLLCPEVAPVDADTATVRKLAGFASRLGYGGFTALYLFGLCAPNPTQLFDELRRLGLEHAVGPEWAEHVDRELDLSPSDALLCAWGYHPVLERARVIARKASHYGRRLEALGLTTGGHPRAPLMMPYRDLGDPVPYVVEPVAPRPAEAPPKRPRGLAAMSPEKRQAIARQGGLAAHAGGNGHKPTREESSQGGKASGASSSPARYRWTPEEARLAGQKGGRTPAEGRHRWTPEEARKAGQRGAEGAHAAGAPPAFDPDTSRAALAKRWSRADAQEAGRKGGKAAAAKRGEP